VPLDGAGFLLELQRKVTKTSQKQNAKALSLQVLVILNWFLPRSDLPLKTNVPVE